MLINNCGYSLVSVGHCEPISDIVESIWFNLTQFESCWIIVQSIAASSDPWNRSPRPQLERRITGLARCNIEPISSRDTSLLNVWGWGRGDPIQSVILLLPIWDLLVTAGRDDRAGPKVAFLRKGGEGTVEWDAVGSNCSIETCLSNGSKMISSKSSNWTIWARWGFPTVSSPLVIPVRSMPRQTPTASSRTRGLPTTTTTTTTSTTTNNNNNINNNNNDNNNNDTDNINDNNNN